MSSDENALLAAIAAYPADDLPRLVYADWLDEHDRPIRAEFIRLQCEIARLEAGPREAMNQHVALWKRQQELMDHHKQELYGSFAEFVSELDVIAHRGFVSELDLEVGELSRVADAVLNCHPPLLTLKLTVEAGEEFDLLQSCRGLPAVTELAIRGLGRPWYRYPSQRVSDFLITAPLTRVRELHLSHCELQNGVSSVSTNRNLGDVTLLDLSFNRLGDADLASLHSAMFQQSLKRLYLRGNGITDVGARALAASTFADGVEWLDLEDNQITADGQQALRHRFGDQVYC